MAGSHADIHDLDKLNRWQKDLAVAAPDAPPVFAIFLVSESDKTAHDIFRAFRSSFEERNAGFAHLVIFGQHGVSTTVHGLQEELGLPPDGLPQLVIFGGEDGTDPDVVSLPGGEAEGAKSDTDAPWQVALRRAEEVFDSGGAASHTVSTVAEDEVIYRTANGTLAGALTNMVRRILAE